MAYFHEQFQRGRDVFIGMVNLTKIPLEADMGDGKLAELRQVFTDADRRKKTRQNCYGVILNRFSGTCLFFIEKVLIYTSQKYNITI